MLDEIYGIKPIYRDIANKAYTTILHTMVDGAKTHPNEEEFAETREEHLKHALEHIKKALEGDTSEDHIGHAMARCAMI